ncbi:hypothetical protein V9T40_005256 [Parthenolecanium corni]|uniref:SAC3/GANP/THP3 conserved domain-containing protein n=1 Tax=Parthenolecanium corni TaxID=536013 RepID=A0AAN9TDH2_9HEMI
MKQHIERIPSGLICVSCLRLCYQSKHGRVTLCSSFILCRKSSQSLPKMLYDDVDVNILDAKDTFGVTKTTNPFRNFGSPDDNEPSNPSKSLPRKSTFKWELSTDSQKPAKQSKRSKADVDLFAGNGSTSIGTGASLAESKIIEKQHEPSTDFKDKIAVTFQDKLSVLEERDRYLRDTTTKRFNKNMNIIVVGTCPDMCPEKERLLREIHCSFSSFEAQIVQNEMLVVPEWLVKEYSRSSADQDEPLSHELRPEPVLVDTMAHILANIVPRIEDSAVDAGEWYHFCWDRLRSIRKDIVQQQLCSVDIVTVLERSARFHICCAERLFDAERRVFDHKINAENLVNCLQMLINMYDDLAAMGIRCANESEFRVYMMLLLFESGDVPELLDRRDEKATEASRIYLAFKLNLYAQFFKLIKRTSYLNACILQRYFGGVRSHILNVLVSAYSSGSQIVKFPVAFARKVLEFDSNEETISFVEAHGFTTFYDHSGGASEVRCSKSTFMVPEQLPVCKSSYILRSKRVPMLEAITTVPDFVPPTRTCKVHSSFNEFDQLKADAHRAEDQRQRIIELYGNIYEYSENEGLEEDEPMRGETPTNERRPSFSPKVTPEPPKISTPPAPTTALSSFSFSNAISSLNFGSINSQPPSTQFRFSEMPARPPTASTTSSLSESDFGITPLPTDSATSAEEKSSASVLYDPEYPSDGDVDELDAEVPNVKLMYELDEEMLLEPKHVKKAEINEAISESRTSECTPSPTKSSPSPPADSVRNSEEVASRLASALSTFQSLYYDKEAHVVPASINEASRHTPMQLSTRKLRKLVARRLKLSKARKYARLWHKKTQLRKRRRDNFVGIVHLSPDEYFRLWGVVGAKERSMARNLVTEVLDTEKALRWSSALLRGDDAWCVSFAGDELINTISRVPGIQGRSVLCWKMMVSLPQSYNDSQRMFVSKLSKLVRALYYKPDSGALRSVWSARAHGSQIYVAANILSGALDDDSAAGVSCIVAFVCEKWEKWEDLKVRLESIYTRTSYPVFIGAIIVGDSDCATFSSKVSSFLNELCKRNVIAGCCTTTWKRWSTICQVVSNACQRIPRSPPFQVRSVTRFVRQVGGDLFACLHCAAGATPLSSPIPLIRAYNECLLAAGRIVGMRSMSDFNLSSEFVEALVDAGADAKTNFSHNGLIQEAVAEFALVSFTKWPPRSVHKMETLLTEYCQKLDATNALLANVLRLIGAGGSDSVAEMNARAPWLQIVELWFRYRLQNTSSDEYEKLFVIYSETEVKDLVERMAVELMS